MEKKVLTQEEIDKITKLKQQFEDLTGVAGNVEIQIMNLQLQKDQIKTNLQQLQQQEAVLAKELEEKYGNGTISLESGEFLPKNRFLRNFHIFIIKHKINLKWQKH
jgi:hypothetical protein